MCACVYTYIHFHGAGSETELALRPFENLKQQLGFKALKDEVLGSLEPSGLFDISLAHHGPCTSHAHLLRAWICYRLVMASIVYVV